MRITDKMRLNIFVLGFRLVAYDGSWWIARREAYGEETLMLGINTEADVAKGDGYYKTARLAMDSFIRASRRGKK